MSLPLQILLAALCFVAGVVVTGIVRVLPGFLPDIPNERSSHDSIVPRGGGLGIALPCLFAAVALFFTSGQLAVPSSIAFLVGGLSMLALGLLDDAFHLQVLPRLATEGVVAIAVCAWGLPDRIAICEGTLVQGPIVTGLQALAIVTALNFFNFMDGIDTLAAAEAIFAGLSLAVFLAAGPSAGGVGLPPESAVALSLAAATAGFLLWNLPPAAIFMGDGGSYFLGFALSYLALRVVGMDPPAFTDGGHVPMEGLNAGLLAALSIWFVFLLDPLATLSLRMLKRENPFRAHRDHLYQLLYHGGWSAGAVAGLLTLANALLVGAVLGAGQLGWKPALLPLGAMALVVAGYIALRFRAAPAG